MATNVENKIEQEGLVWGMAKFMYSWETARMLSKSPVKGYFAPGTIGPSRFVAGQLAGRGLGGETVRRVAEGGLRFGGLTGIRSGAALKMGTGAAFRRAIFGGGVQTVSRGVAGKVLLGRAAGLGLKAFNIYMWGALAIGLPLMGYQAIAGAIKTHKGLELGGYFPETRGSVTSRQRTVRAITDSRLQARSVIGNEAMLMHR